MAQRFETKYKVKGGDNLAAIDFWNPRLQDLDRRLDASEIALSDLNAIGDRIEGVALDRVNNSLTPLILEAQEHLQAIGNLFVASSTSTLTIGTGALSLVLAPTDRDTFAISIGWVVLHPVGDTSRGMVGSVTSYDEVAGALVLDIAQAFGGGTSSSWSLAVATPPDLAHAARTDNPHGTEAHQVGAYTTAEVDAIVAALNAALAPKISPDLQGSPTATTPPVGDNSHAISTTAFVAAAIAALKNWLVNGAGATLDQFNELAAALGNDPNFATTILNQLGLKLPAANPAFTGTMSGPTLNLSSSIQAPTGYFFYGNGYGQVQFGTENNNKGQIYREPSTGNLILNNFYGGTGITQMQLAYGGRLWTGETGFITEFFNIRGVVLLQEAYVDIYGGGGGIYRAGAGGCVTGIAAYHDQNGDTGNHDKLVAGFTWRSIAFIDRLNNAYVIGQY